MIITASIFESVRVVVTVQPFFTRAAHSRSLTPECLLQIMKRYRSTRGPRA